MKKLILVVFVALMALPGYSQLLKFGIKVGAETDQVPSYTAITSGQTAIDAAKSAQWGFNAGIFLRIKLLGLYIQPEAVFGSTTFNYNVTQNAVTAVEKQQFNRLSVPILIGFKLGPIRINAGPAASVQLSSPKDLISGQNFQDLYKKAVWGYQAGLGLDLFKKLTIDARYAGGFGKQEGSTTIAGQTFNFTNAKPSVLLSVGFMF